MLARVVNDNAPILERRGVLEFFASKLAPTVGFGCSEGGDYRPTTSSACKPFSPLTTPYSTCCPSASDR
ncbi:hypothetical protein EJA72_26825 [Pseudomonas sp. PB120]|nr:hypothetical protein [Pseudomonas sp. PB120]